MPRQGCPTVPILSKRLAPEHDSPQSHTATPAINGGKWRYSAALSEIRAVFLNGAQRSVNREVQGSNPWSGANCKFDLPDHDDRWPVLDSNRIATG